jgi:hypothetical protein
MRSPTILYTTTTLSNITISAAGKGAARRLKEGRPQWVAVWRAQEGGGRREVQQEGRRAAAQTFAAGICARGLGKHRLLKVGLLVHVVPAARAREGRAGGWLLGRLLACCGPGGLWAEGGGALKRRWSVAYHSLE